MRFEDNSPTLYGPRLAAAAPIFFSLLLLLAAASGAQSGRDPEAPDNLREPPADAVETETGLVTAVIREGTTGVKPDINDMVSVHYVGWTAYGAKFQSSYDRGQPGVFNLTDVFPVWQEALLMMDVGEKRRLWVPEQLAPKSDDAPAGAVVFDVELMGVRPVPNPPKSLRKPPEDAELSVSGAYSRRIAEGTGDAKPGATDVALMEWTGWTTNGRTFDSTVYRGRPTAFPLDRVLAPFADVVREMVVGEKRQIWIPAQLAAGQWPGGPRGQLILEVELVTILTKDVLQQGKPVLPESGSR